MIVPVRDEIPGVDEQRAEQLYRLLPAIYRLRDEQLAPPAQGNGPRRGPLFELLSVIALGAEELEADIARLYNDAFIETCADWVVPYIADLVGYRPVDDAGAAGSPVTPAGQALNRALTSRREVANTIYLRRRKGALHLLEQLAHAVAGWPARAVEGFDRVALLGAAERPAGARGRMVRVSEPRDHGRGDAAARRADPRSDLDRLGGPFDTLGRCADVHLPGPRDRLGRAALRTITLYAWTTRAYPVTFAPPAPTGRPGCFTFDPSGADIPLYINPTPEPRPADIAAELNLPVRLRTQALVEHKQAIYGPGLSLCVYRGDGAGGFVPVPAEQIVAADLPDRPGGWAYYPHDSDAAPSRLPGSLAIDPERGRLMAYDSAPLLRVSYHYGFGADIGAGEYIRTSEGAAEDEGDWQDRGKTSGGPAAQDHDIIEFRDSARYDVAPPPDFTLQAGCSLTLRAGYLARPTLTFGAQRDPRTRPRIANHRRHVFQIAAEEASIFVLDGLFVRGGTIRVSGSPATILIRRCTFAPRNLPQLTIALDTDATTRIVIERSIICGQALRCLDRPAGGRVELVVSESMILGSSVAQEVPGAPDSLAQIALTVDASTVIGSLHVRSLKATNTIFAGNVRVAEDSQANYCYLPNAPGSGEDHIARLNCPSHLERPRFVATTYGHPQLCRLRQDCPAAIRRGADDGGELGVYHHLYLPQREAVLRARLEEYSVAALDPQLIIVE